MTDHDDIHYGGALKTQLSKFNIYTSKQPEESRRSILEGRHQHALIWYSYVLQDIWTYQIRNWNA